MDHGWAAEQLIGRKTAIVRDFLDRKSRHSGQHTSGPVGVKGDETPVRVYLEELRAQVLTGLNAGKSADDLVKSVTMDDYKSWGWVYNTWRPMNIHGMARHLEAIGAVD